MTTLIDEADSIVETQKKKLKMDPRVDSIKLPTRIEDAPKRQIPVQPSPPLPTSPTFPRTEQHPAPAAVSQALLKSWAMAASNGIQNWDSLVPSLLQQRANVAASTVDSSPHQQPYQTASPYSLYHPSSLLNSLNINAVAFAAVQQVMNARTAAVGLPSMTSEDLVAAMMRKNGLFVGGAKDLLVNMPSHAGLMVSPTKYTPL